jgi:L-aspartate oxidase
VHGANRLASNSLLEGLVFGARAASAMTAPPRAAAGRAAAVHDLRIAADAAAIAVPSEDEVRDFMWQRVGLIRDRGGLEHAAGTMEAWWAAVSAARGRDQPVDRDVRRIESLVTVGMLMARAALRRRETRGGHFRSDFPERDDRAWRMHVAERLDAGAVQA